MTLFTKLKNDGTIAANAVFPGGTKDNHAKIWISEYEVTIPAGTSDYKIEIWNNSSVPTNYQPISRIGPGVLSFQWGDWVTLNNGTRYNPIYITAENPGMATLFFTFNDTAQTINPFEIRIINITVT